ncbi:Tlg2-vesicle protein [Orbilia oligospora]|uniref:Golgi apparatus membrane protein TVP38 n=1 Tax=Orbilia oligospora TaxID=2813651 RepID=A0A7C8K405_ORBOL|nr:Tlg2-vesicle protein [Orbilia oligospora]
MSTDHPRGALYTPPMNSSSNTTTAPTWTRSGRRSRSSSTTSVTSASSNLITNVWKLKRKAHQYWNKLSLAQKIIGCTALAVLNIGILLGVIYHEAIFHWFSPIADKWREMPYGFLILFTWTFISAFPPMIGYSTSITLAGFIYGVPNGWYIASSGTVIGSTAAFIACRLYFRDFAQRMVSTDKRFAALSLTLKHDGLKLLCMIRLCPLPYSISNGAMSTFPTVSAWKFAVAGAVASPKLFIHVFIGHQMKVLGETGEKMDAGTKALNYGSMIFGALFGMGTGWFIYKRTVRRARQLEAEERRRVVGNAAGGSTGSGEGEEVDMRPSSRNVTGRDGNNRDGYSDDPVEEELERTLSGGRGGGGGGSGGRYVDEEGGKGGKRRDGIAGRAMGVFNGIFGGVAADTRFLESEGEEEEGRLLDGDELMEDEDAEELLVVEDEGVEMEGGKYGRR